MWERGARHNPASLRYRFYADHRPFLPQDPTLSFLRSAEGSYESVYYPFRLDGSGNYKYIYSNNIPVKDREDFKNIVNQDISFRKNFKFLAALSAIFFYKQFSNVTNFGNKHWKKMLLAFACFKISHLYIHLIYSSYLNNTLSYYYFKYQNIAVSDIKETVDPRREFIYLDKSSYYRETSQEIRHNAHHPANKGHDHDTSTYYGPYPVRIFLIFRKFFLNFFSYFFF